MFIIHGSKPVIKNFGYLINHKCNECDTFFTLISVTTWLTFFFIPIFPWNWEYWMACPTCSEENTIHGIKIKSSEFKKIKKDALKTEDLEKISRILDLSEKK